MSPTVSVIVPIYNTARYAENCVRSLMAQSYRDVEILLIDDGSDDGSEKICDRLAEEDPRLRVLHKPNAGSAAARNDGIGMATGKYIAFAESDDAVETGIYTELVSAAEKTGADIVKCDYHKVTGDRKTAEKAFDAVAPEGETFAAWEKPMIFTKHASIWASLYRRAFLTENGIRFIETPAATYSDFSFMAATYAKAERITVVHKPLYDYRCDNAFSSRVRQGEKCCFKPFHCIQANRILRESGHFDEVKEELGYQEYRTCLSHTRYIRPDVRDAYFEKMREALLDLTADGFTFRLFRPWERRTASAAIAGNRKAFYRGADAEKRVLTLLGKTGAGTGLAGWLKRNVRKTE